MPTCSTASAELVVGWGGVFRGRAGQKFPFGPPVPSGIWYENSPLTIHEAFATRAPLFVSDPDGMAARLTRFLGELELRASFEFAREPLRSVRRSAEELEARHDRTLSSRGMDPKRGRA